MSDSYVSVVAAENITCGTLLGPLPLSSGSPDSLAVLTWRCVDKLPTSKQVLKVTIKDKSGSKVPSWISHILPARNPEEQTLEVVVKAGHLYFRALRDVDSGQELRAWFGQDLADILKLPLITPMTVEDEKRYECMLCQERFENPFPVVTHLMYRCRFRDQGALPPAQNPFRRRHGGRVKNFDIATLTDMDDDRDAKTREEDRTSPVLNLTSTDRESPDQDTTRTGKRTAETDDLGTSKRTRPPLEGRTCAESRLKKVDVSRSVEGGGFKPPPPAARDYPAPSFRPGVDINANEGGSSAFKKVDKSGAGFVRAGLSPELFPAPDPRDLLFQNGFAPFHYALPPAHAPLPHNGAAGLHHLAPAALEAPLPAGVHHLKMSEELKAVRKLQVMHEGGFDVGLMSVGGARMPGVGFAAKSHQPLDGFGAPKSFPAPLLPFLPPSLAALSFPTQNWCAKCNASFRMTSDLVYHMRSHHKRETDPQKLKREEKLRCHICNETFRERHHLTRHMTSHQ